jgi:hypothetical protein
MAPPMPGNARSSTRLKLLAVLVGGVVLPALVLLLIEGASSYLTVAWRAWRHEEPPLSSRLHTRYDPELGWVSLPNVFVPDLYGPGIYLRTNARGFRGGRDVAGQVPPGRIRMICSGDSFTLGYGVNDDESWCARLAARDPRLEAVNMGQGGYGQDQAYLWYKRDGARLEHDVHVFAYITLDFDRMQSRFFLGRGKPVLALENDSLVVRNVPVPPPAPRPSGFRRVVQARTELHTVRLLHKARDAVLGRWSRDEGGDGWGAADSLTWEVSRRMLADLGSLNRAKGSTLVVVHLPVIDDYWSHDSEPWRERARAAAAQGDFVFVDLVEDFRRVAADSVPQMFIGFVLPDYPDQARRHYSVSGNDWVAARLYQRLLGLLAVSRANGRRADGGSSGDGPTR